MMTENVSFCEIQRTQVQTYYKRNHWEDLWKKDYSGTLNEKLVYECIYMLILTCLRMHIHTHNIFQVVKIAQRGSKKKKLPKILIDAGIHARCAGHLIFKTFFFKHWLSGRAAHWYYPMTIEIMLMIMNLKSNWWQFKSS